MRTARTKGLRERRYVVGPVRRALQLLDVLEAAGHPLTLSELADRAGLPKNTAFRYLYTLRSARLVAGMDGADTFVPGPRLAATPVAEDAVDRLKRAAMRSMRGLQHRFNETVNLATGDARRITYVAMVGSTRFLRLDADLAHAAACGYALELEENEVCGHCVAACIPTPSVLVAISISGPAQRLPVEMLERCGQALVRAASTIAATLG